MPIRFKKNARNKIERPLRPQIIGKTIVILFLPISQTKKIEKKRLFICYRCQISTRNRL